MLQFTFTIDGTIKLDVNQLIKVPVYIDNSSQIILNERIGKSFVIC